MLSRLHVNKTRVLAAAFARTVSEGTGCHHTCQFARRLSQLSTCRGRLISCPIPASFTRTVSRGLQLTTTRLYARTKRRASPVLERPHEIRVDVALEGTASSTLPCNEQSTFAEQLEREFKHALDITLQQVAPPASSRVKRTELSVVLTDDTYIADLNLEWRGKAGSTDVLSFPMGNMPPGMPVRMLGDVIISLPTAQRQADERGHDLKDEVRILLLHGDHAAAGLEGPWSDSSRRGRFTKHAQARGSVQSAPEPGGIKLICLDMDGTLLDSNSKVLPSSIEAIRAALSRGVKVCLATGKARPAAFEALKPVGLAGPGQLATYDGPGIFLQGLAVYGGRGQLLPGKTLPPAVVEAGFKYSMEAGIPLSAFLGDECVTLQHAPELQELHERYYEPLTAVQPSLEAILQGPPVKKLLFMTDADVITKQVIPHWQKVAGELGAQATQAVPTMLELVPTGVDKWVGLQQLLRDLGIAREATMGVGDGGNDLTMVQHAGVGVAMGNAVAEVKAVATAVVADNDSDGVAQAIERFCLSA
ncbi:hypothetical protein WJX73_003896 [Symbiochloris irregularis]|uniref:Haloacid dehalogenase-like hydrolase n=1 Tax=Symbiochloris irregularis TaxID=706552 RepID=A0AAW1NTU1_9CHLO